MKKILRTITVDHERAHGIHVYTARSEDRSLAPQSRETDEAALGALVKLYADKFGLRIEVVDKK